MKVYCCVCTRQISDNVWSKDLQAPTPVTYMGTDQYCCADCSRNLDEFGLFPEERTNLEI